MGVAQGKCTQCIRSNHPRVGNLLHEKRMETGATWAKKSHRNKRNICRCKKQGKGRRRKTISRDMRSAEKFFCRHLKQEKIHLLLLGQGKFPREGTKGNV